jgi:hypothetical protein
MTRTLFLAGALLGAAVPLAAQQPEQRIDRVGHIVAMVGDSAILNFDIQEAHPRARRPGAAGAAAPERRSTGSWRRSCSTI